MHFKNLAIIAVVLAAASVAAPAAAVTNLIKNGSFEAGAVGTGGFLQWTKSNVPSNAPASVINYNSTASYPNGAFGESVFADNSVSASPDAVAARPLISLAICRSTKPCRSSPICGSVTTGWASAIS